MDMGRVEFLPGVRLATAILPCKILGVVLPTLIA